MAPQLYLKIIIIKTVIWERLFNSAIDIFTQVDGVQGTEYFWAFKSAQTVYFHKSGILRKKTSTDMLT